MSTPLLDDFVGPFRMARARLDSRRWVMGKRVRQVQPPLDANVSETDRTPLSAASKPTGELMLRVSPALAKHLNWPVDGIVYFRVVEPSDDAGDIRGLLVEVR